MSWGVYEVKVGRVGATITPDFEVTYVKHETCGGLHVVFAKPGSSEPLSPDDFRTEAVRQHLDGKICRCAVAEGDDPVAITIVQTS